MKACLRARTLTVAALLMALTAAACGQKSGVAGSGGGVAAGGGAGVEAGGDLGEGADTGLTGTESATGTEGAAGGGTGGAAAATGTAAGGARPGAAPGGTAAAGTAAGAAAAPTGPGDRTGISATSIRIGIHAPVTGAAPFPQTTFERGKEIYWQFIKKSKGGVFGKLAVEVVFKDDQFNPAKATEVCKEMVEKEKVFLLVGGGGADQITACAQYASSVGVPYLSAGVNESVVNGLKTFFAISQTYSQQSPLLAQLLKNKLGITDIAIVVADTPSFKDAHQSFEKAAEGAGLAIKYNKTINKDANETEATTTANEISRSGAKAVYILSSPTVFLRLAAAGQGQGYRPQYVGPGITSGLNLVTTAGCPAVTDAMFLSPFPQLDAIDQMDKDFRPAYREFGGAEPDDIGIALWGLAKSIHAFLEAAGPTVSRQSLMATLESGKEFATGVYPPVKYAAGRHFGATQSHLLQADCGSRTYKTVARFASGF